MKSSRFTRFASTAGLFLLMTAPFASAAGGEHKSFAEKSLWDMVVLGGPVMIPLAGFSIAMLWLIIDGSMRSGLKRMMPEAELERPAISSALVTTWAPIRPALITPTPSTTSCAPVW